jgi:hypothetical protein
MKPFLYYQPAAGLDSCFFCMGQLPKENDMTTPTAPKTSPSIK